MPATDLACTAAALVLIASSERVRTLGTMARSWHNGPLSVGRLMRALALLALVARLIVKCNVQVTMLADTQSEFAKAMDLVLDAEGMLGNKRMKRFSAVIKGGKFVEVRLRARALVVTYTASAVCHAIHPTLELCGV